MTSYFGRICRNARQNITGVAWPLLDGFLSGLLKLTALLMTVACGWFVFSQNRISAHDAAIWGAFFGGLLAISAILHAAIRVRWWRDCAPDSNASWISDLFCVLSLDILFGIASLLSSLGAACAWIACIKQGNALSITCFVACALCTLIVAILYRQTLSVRFTHAASPLVCLASASRLCCQSPIKSTVLLSVPAILSAAFSLALWLVCLQSPSLLSIAVILIGKCLATWIEPILWLENHPRTA